MKRTFLDITKKVSREINKVKLIPYDLSDTSYWIFEATGWKLFSVLREMEAIDLMYNISVSINTQNIGKTDFLVEQGKTGLLIKFIKSKFSYQLDSTDFIYISGPIERYA